MKEIRFTGWMDRKWHTGMGRTLYHDVRKYWMWVGPYAIAVEFHGWGPRP